MTPNRASCRPAGTVTEITSAREELPRAEAGPVRIAVAIPAHEEAELISSCVHAVLRAIAHAQRVGAADRALVLVAAHRCTDETAARAREAMQRLPRQVAAIVVPDDGPGPVGAVRHRLVTRAAEHPWITPEAWVFSTDADSRVPTDWVTGLLAAAQHSRADAVAGLVALQGWHADEAARAAYERIVAAGIHGSSHDHAYAANLAVRLSAYTAVGGFPPAPHGEERELLQALRAAGHTVATPHAPIVLTSARMPGRADHGLGALLAALAEREQHLPSLSEPVAG
ncbi:glycosyltransferase [Gephyromycinifex aptenodytis]|uniref:glycosyltransferase n=1 Tax=Gephyromycinifex aptenodytis TaxID=2716227 RepID=UPI0014484271|nr:glycosyltransferase family 2 protein [Gephyromycinifex aptenodytis]